MSLEDQNINTPEKEYDFSKGATLEANSDMPLLGLKKGDRIKLENDGPYLRKEPISYTSWTLTDLIEQGVWTLVDESES